MRRSTLSVMRTRGHSPTHFGIGRLSRQCPNNLHLFQDTTDVDFGAKKKQSRAISDFRVARGYLPDEGIYMASEGARHAYLHRDTGLNVDVFADELYFCHRIPFKGRLESCARIGALLHLHHELETRPRLSRSVLLAWRGGAPHHPRPNRRFARGNRGGAEDARLEDALQDRNAKPLVPRGLR